MNTIGDRLRYARELRGLRQERLAEMINVSQTTITNLEVGKNKTSKKLLDMAKVLEIDPNWLATGQGEKPTAYSPKHKAKTSNAVMEISANYKPIKEEVHIYHLSASASMGHGLCANQDHDQIIGLITASKQWANKHLQNATSPKNVYIITGQGDSMEPTFKDGAPLFVDTGISEINTDGIYVFEYDQELYIKRLSRQMGEIMVLSDNPKYQAFTMTKEKLAQTRIIGRIIGTCPFVEI